MNAYLFAGYVVIWTILFSYLLYLTREQKQINKKLKSLSETLHKRNQ
ncbi:CcmD family protein [Acidobacteria bacterium AH-259-O06]|nr:CcmD family protein [Acidobacteria bacterium AH-259-O06]